MTPEDRLAALGLELPSIQMPLASYIPTRLRDHVLHLSGQGPLRDGKPAYQGKVGGELTIEQGQEAARLTALNALATIRSELGELSRVKMVLNMTAYVACVSDFHFQHLVMNGASDLLVEVLGEAGRHTRVAIGTNVLPLNLPVELSLMIEVH